MTDIVWTSPAFEIIEKLPEKSAFGIVRQTDFLRRHPEMGSPMAIRSKSLYLYRQIVHRRRFRVVYRFDARDNCVYICAVQDCRQKLPTALELKKAGRRGDLSIDE